MLYTIRLLAGLMVLAGFGLAGCKPRSDAESPGSGADAVALADLGVAPSWTLRDLEGKPVNSTDLKGKVVVVDFWATWCPPCVAEIPGYVALQEKYRDKLTIVGISMDSFEPAVIKNFAVQRKINYTVVMGNDEVSGAFGNVQALPTTFVIDRENKIRFKKVGAASEEEFEKVLKQLL